MIYYKIDEKENGFHICEPEWNPDYNRKTESVFAQCNGYLGIRAAFEVRQPEECRGTFIGGLYHRSGRQGVAELVNCPDVTEFKIRINGVNLFLGSGHMDLYGRSLYTKYGILENHMGCRMDRAREAGRIHVASRRFASMCNKKLFCHRVDISCERGGILEVSTGINGQVTNSGVSHFDSISTQVFDRQQMFMECGTDDGQTLYISTTCVPGVREGNTSFHLEPRSIWQDFKKELKHGETWTLYKYTYFDTKDRNSRILDEAAETGFEELSRLHRVIFDRYWDMASIRIEGASKEELAAVELAGYHLAGMVPWEEDRCSVAAKGLTGEGYKGHVFWDTEIFILPFFTMMFPEVSRNLLMYRYRGLEGARKKAREMGYSGAMYPWEAAVTGMEETPLYAAMDIHTGRAAKVWSARKEHHVTADIIHGLLDYYRITGDSRFMEQYGCRMILETAVFWCTRAQWCEERGRLEIKDVIGPDEYTEHVDNNAYTNYMAYENVKAAVRVLESWNHETATVYAGGGWGDRFRFFLEHLYLPIPDENGIIPQDDTFLGKKMLPDIRRYRDASERQLILKDYSRGEVVDMQVLKQADVVMLLQLLPDLFDTGTVKRNVEFYEERTIHDSSLSQCVHAEAEAAAGDLDMAGRFFRKALEIDLGRGYKDSAAGIHAAAMGGIMNCVLRGFGGIRVSEDGIRVVPHLLAHWKSMEFSIMDHGVRKYVTVTQEGAWITMGNRK